MVILHHIFLNYSNYITVQSEKKWAPFSPKISIQIIQWIKQEIGNEDALTCCGTFSLFHDINCLFTVLNLLIKKCLDFFCTKPTYNNIILTLKNVYVFIYSWNENSTKKPNQFVVSVNFFPLTRSESIKS